MNVLLLRLDAPLMSFGAPIVDRFGKIQPYPALSMITGLLGNALGYHHRDTAALQRLQERIRYASRQDRPGKRLRDYHTVDLGQEFMLDKRAWTTRDKLEQRKGGSASTGTHIRERDYWADAVHTVALTLDPPDESPNLDHVEHALRQPERPLFIGRKPCLPAGPLFLGRTEAPNLVQALRDAPVPPGGDAKARLNAWWPSSPDVEDSPGMQRPVTDGRDWANQIHVGERWIASGHIELSGKEADND